MNGKKSVGNFIAVVLCVIIGFGAGFFIGGSVVFGAHKGDNSGAGGNTADQRELLERIGEYQRREEARIRAEADRIRAEGERIERTQKAIDAVRESDRRTGDLYQELRAQINILANYFGDSVDIHNNELGNMGSE